MVKELLKKLINALSTSDVGELGSANVLKDFFSSCGVSSQVDIWDEDRANFWVHIPGKSGKSALMFASHLDVVPPGREEWMFPPFSATEHENRIYGRGAADMKAGNAAIAAAAVEMIKSGKKLENDLIICSTAGEETDSCGAKRFVDKYKSSFPLISGVILPEPTDFNIITGHRGIYWVKIITTGKTAHGSMPHLGINSINSMALVLEKLRDFEPECVPSENFGSSTFSVNQINGGKAANVIPDRCEITIDIRTIPGQNIGLIDKQLNEIFNEIKSDNPDFDARIEVVRKVDGMETDRDCEFVNRVRSATGIDETKIVGYTTDAPIFKNFGAPIIVFGPGKTEQAHQPNEYVDVPDLCKAVEYYKKIINSML